MHRIKESALGFGSFSPISKNRTVEGTEIPGRRVLDRGRGSSPWGPKSWKKMMFTGKCAIRGSG